MATRGAVSRCPDPLQCEGRELGFPSCHPALSRPKDSERRWPLAGLLCRCLKAPLSTWAQRFEICWGQKGTGHSSSLYRHFSDLRICMPSPSPDSVFLKITFSGTSFLTRNCTLVLSSPPIFSLPAQGESYLLRKPQCWTITLGFLEFHFLREFCSCFHLLFLIFFLSSSSAHTDFFPSPDQHQPQHLPHLPPWWAPLLIVDTQLIKPLSRSQTVMLRKSLLVCTNYSQNL